MYFLISNLRNKIWFRKWCRKYQYFGTERFQGFLDIKNLLKINPTFNVGP